MFRIDLCKDKGFQWAIGKNYGFKGYIWYQDKYFEGVKAKELLNEISSEQALVKLLKSINGCFAGYWENTDAIFLFADIIRSIPLFYDLHHQVITDDVTRMKDYLQEGNIDETAVVETIQTSMHACDDRTWISSVKQTMAGEMVKLYKNQKRKAERKLYYKHTHTELNQKKNVKDYFEEADRISVHVFERLIKALDGRTAIIPLSGGYDSRYIAGMLKRLGYENVVCYTYGKPKNNYEVDYSKKTADALGYQHFFVEYTPKVMDHIFQNEGHQYRLYATCYSNLMHIQEIPALLELLKDDKFPKQGVIIPGFSGDLFGGSYTFSINQEYNYKYNEELLVDTIYRRFFNCSRYGSEYIGKIKQDIYKYLTFTDCEVKDLISFNAEAEHWFIVHKQGMFIVNAVRPYEFLGYSWYLPLWDREMLDYWYEIPMKYRQLSPLYEAYLFEKVFKPQNIDFVKEGHGDRQQIFIPERKKYRIIANEFLNFMYFKLGIKIRKWSNDVNNFDYAMKRAYKEIEYKKCLSFDRYFSNAFLSILELEQLMPDKNITSKILKI